MCGQRARPSTAKSMKRGSIDADSVLSATMGEGSSKDGEGILRPASGWNIQHPPSPLRQAQPEQITLDVNLLAEGKPFMALGAMAVSPDGNLLAYSTDPTGFRQYTLHIRNLRTGPGLSMTDLPDTAERVGSLAWADDSRTLFYSTEDETTKRQDRIFRHTLGAPVQADALALFEEDERFNLGIGKTRDGQYLLIEAGSHTTNEYRFLAASDPTGEFRIRSEEHTSELQSPT